DKYLVRLTYRYDGPSRMGNNKFGFVPGVALGRNVPQESFFSESPLAGLVSNLTPRMSDGVHGNLESLALPGQAASTANYVAFGSYGSQGVYDGQTGYANTGLPTLDLKWERSTTLNFGLDLSLFNNRVNLLGDYFIRDVEDKISNLSLPHWTGFSSMRTNK